jgi:hypothetical protein
VHWAVALVGLGTGVASEAAIATVTVVVHGLMALFLGRCAASRPAPKCALAVSTSSAWSSITRW